MTAARTAVLYAPGTNCHEETVAAIAAAGGQAEIIFLRDLLASRARLADYQATVIPGGFSYGDHLGAGRIFGLMLARGLRDQLAEFLESRRPMLGICNGFQVLAEAGILPGRTLGRQSMALVGNETSHFEDRRIRLVVSAEKSIWTEGLEGQILRMPSAHGEGRAFFRSAEPPRDLRALLHYADEQNRSATAHPANPSGSPEGIAGVTDATGLILGLMPHPERASLPAHDSQDGLKLFRNLVKWLKS